MKVKRKFTKKLHECNIRCCLLEKSCLQSDRLSDMLNDTKAYVELHDLEEMLKLV